ncbi:hybrid sensor histidine kinase/response regulator [Desulfococcaceae bacterium HSG7]|nr:hybrid sensor histidine kinase/response regulator [Desulfococcaceae bacterium HSG7]
MRIEDNELRDIFKTESEERLQNLEDGLLLLEKNPQDPSVLAEVFREAHSLKGAGRMVGLKNLELAAHRFEDVLGKAKRGELILESAIIDRLYKGLDAIRNLANQAVTGELSDVDIASVLTSLDLMSPNPELVVATPPESCEPSASDSKIETPPPDNLKTPVPEQSVPEDSVPEQPASEQPGPEQLVPEQPEPVQQPVPHEADTPAGTLMVADEKTPPPKERYRIETVRVKPEKLDALMTQAGELTVTKIRIAQRTSQVDTIIESWDELSHDLTMNFIRSPSFAKNADFKKIASAMRSDMDGLGDLLNKLKNESSEDLARLDLIAANLEEGIRTVRLLPLATVFNLFPRMVRDLARTQEKEIDLQIEGGETTADKRILEEMKDPLMHLIRNAVDHGIEPLAERRKIGKSTPAAIHLRAFQTSSDVVIEIEDDGRGLDIEAIRNKARQRKLRHEDDLTAMTPEQIQVLIFSSGFSTSTYVTDVSGRGIGLDVVRNNIANLKGSIHVESVLGRGCLFRMKFPITLATTRVLIVAVDGCKYALPVEFVETTLQLAHDEIFSIEGRQTVIFENNPISVARLSDLLEIRPNSSEIENSPNELQNDISKRPLCIIIGFGEEKLGMLVDELTDEQEIVLKPSGGLLKRVRNVSGATILGTGEVCMVLNPADLIQSVQKHSRIGVFEESAEEAAQQTILLVEDSITTRTQEKRILEGAGYEVVTAVDGLDALDCLNSHHFDAVVSDIEMPNMDGWMLTEKIREDKKYSEMPIILVTSLASEEDKKKGAEAGADAYITKGGFEQEVLLDTLDRLV